MLKIRRIQLDVLKSAQAKSTHDVAVAMLWHRRDEFRGDIDLGYVEGLVAFAIEQCQQRDLDRIGTWVGVAASLLKDDVHPMSLGRRDEKVNQIFQELACQALFGTLKAFATTSALRPATRSQSDQ